MFAVERLTSLDRPTGDIEWNTKPIEFRRLLGFSMAVRVESDQ